MVKKPNIIDVSVEITNDLDYTNLADLREKISEWISLYGEKSFLILSIDSEPYSDYERAVAKVFYSREETPEEESQRKLREMNIKENTEKYDREQFEKLKKKYEWK